MDAALFSGCGGDDGCCSGESPADDDDIREDRRSDLFGASSSSPDSIALLARPERVVRRPAVAAAAALEGTDGREGTLSCSSPASSSASSSWNSAPGIFCGSDLVPVRRVRARMGRVGGGEDDGGRLGEVTPAAAGATESEAWFTASPRASSCSCRRLSRASASRR